MSRPIDSHTAGGSESFPSSISRRRALQALIAAAGATALLGMPRIALAASATKETTDALNSAQAQLDDAQKQLDDLASQFEKLSGDLDDTKGDIETVNQQIADTQDTIDALQDALEARQEQLANRVSSTYKSGDVGVLQLLVSSTSFDELLSNLHYIDKINENDQENIKEVQRIQDELANQKAALEERKSELEDLEEQQTQQLADMKEKKDEVQQLLDSLSDQVKELIAKRDAEILAAAQAEEAARKAAEEAAKRQQAGGTTSIPGDGQAAIEAGTAQQLIVSTAKSTPSPGTGLCAAWVSQVFQNAGFGYVGGNADDMYANYCTSSSKSVLKVGMIIAVPTHPHTSAGRIYGHVGIYVGNNTVMDNVGYIRSINVDEWISYYGPTATPRWGWALGIDLEG